MKKQLLNRLQTNKQKKKKKKIRPPESTTDLQSATYMGTYKPQQIARSYTTVTHHITSPESPHGSRKQTQSELLMCTYAPSGEGAWGAGYVSNLIVIVRFPMRKKSSHGKFWQAGSKGCRPRGGQLYRGIKKLNSGKSKQSSVLVSSSGPEAPSLPLGAPTATFRSNM